MSTTKKKITTGMTIAVGKKLFRVESAVKVTVAKGNPFIKAKLRNLATDELSEKNFKPDQDVNTVSLEKRNLEFLYPEGKGYSFMDIDTFDQLAVARDVVGEKAEYLKEGVEVTGTLSETTVYSIELPQFLELLVVQTEGEEEDLMVSDATQKAVLETGATVDVPPFIRVGDIVKVDTGSGDYIQRV